MSYDSEANRRRQISSRYGITSEMYDWLLQEQDSLCVLCGLEETRVHYRSGELVRLNVDHAHNCECDHEPLKKGCVHCIRGLTCKVCNLMLLPLVEGSALLAARFGDYLAARPLLDKFPDWDCRYREQTLRILKRREAVADLRESGKTYREIADELGITHSTAVRDYQAWEMAIPETDMSRELPGEYIP